MIKAHAKYLQTQIKKCSICGKNKLFIRTHLCWKGEEMQNPNLVAKFSFSTVTI